MNHPEREGLSPQEEQEQATDLAWLNEHLTLFWPVAHYNYTMSGRGALVIDASSEPLEEIPPFHYALQALIEEQEDEVSLRLAKLVEEYDPHKELVVVVIKPGLEFSMHGIGVGETLIQAVQAANLAEGKEVQFESEEELEKIQALHDQFEPLYQQVLNELKLDPELD